MYNIYKKNNLLKYVLLMSFIAVAWTLSQKNGLIFDDYSLLSVAKENSYKELLTLLPSSSYNDRSFRMVFLKMLIDLFDDNYIAYHIVFVICHLTNVALVYWIFYSIAEEFGENNSLFGNKVDNYSIYAATVALIFGAYPTSLMAVQWISSTCDFQCATGLLLSFYFYLKYRSDSEYEGFYGICAFGFYWYSLRCKEMSLCLPIIYFLYEIYRSGERRKARKNNSISFCLVACILFMLIYTYLLFTGGQSLITEDNPYYMSFNPFLMLRDAFRYMALYFDITNGTLVFNEYTLGAKVAIVITIFLILYAVYRFMKKDILPVLSFLALGISIIVVLPMVNLQHRLYLYLPSIFISNWIVCSIYSVIYSVNGKIEKGNNGQDKNAILITCKSFFVIIALVCFLTSYAPGITTFRNWWMETSQNDKRVIDQIKSLKQMPESTHIYIHGANDGYNVFYYGPGDVFNLVFNDETLTTYLVDKYPLNPLKPFVLLDYSDGMLKEIKRDETKVEQ